MNTKLNFFLKNIAQFLPIAFFVLVARYYGFTDEGWEKAFYIGALASIIVLCLNRYQGLKLADLFIGLGLFLIVGSFAFLFNLTTILQLYGDFKETVFWLGILVVKIAVLLAPNFFKDIIEDFIPEFSPNLLLVLLTGTCTYISILYSGQLLYSAILPFIGLRVINHFLAFRYK